MTFQVSFSGRTFRAGLQEIDEVPTETPAGVFRVRDSTDPELIALQGIAPDSNFAPVKLAGFDSQNKVNFNGIKKFQRIDYEYLKSLQFNEPGDYGSIEKKMRWLVNFDGVGKRPYWKDGDKTDFGTILFGGQLVKVKVNPDGSPVEYRQVGQFPAKQNFEEILFYQVEGMPTALKGVATHSSHPWYIVRATAFNNNNIQTYTPRGATHYHVVWNTDNHPSNYADGKLYIAKKFLMV